MKSIPGEMLVDPYLEPIFGHFHGQFPPRIDGGEERGDTGRAAVCLIAPGSPA